MRLRGQGIAFASGLAAARRLRMHHGLMLTGAQGCGKTSAALEFAQALLCESSNAERACGVCATCQRVDARNHPDLHFVTVAAEKQDISVEQVRDVQIVLGRRAMEGRARIVVFDPADRLTEQGQNALLKTLEEPGDNTFLLLPTSRPESLLATVRSRADRLRLLPVSPDEVLLSLEQRNLGGVADRQFAVARAGGAVGLAATLIDEGITELQQHLVGFVARPTDISAVTLAKELVAGSADRKAAERRVRLVMLCLRSMLRESMLGSLAPSAGPSYFSTTCDSWAMIFETFFEAETDLDLRIAPEQVLCHLALSLQEALPRVI